MGILTSAEAPSSILTISLITETMAPSRAPLPRQSRGTVPISPSGTGRVMPTRPMRGLQISRMAPKAGTKRTMFVCLAALYAWWLRMPETKKTTHLSTVQRQWKLRKLAATRPHFKAVNGKFVPYKIKPPAALDVVIAGEKRAQKKAAVQALENLQIGQATADGTIYLGQYPPKDTEGKPL